VTPTQVRATPLLLLLLLLFPAAQMSLRRRRRPAPHSDKTRMRVIAASLSTNLKKCSFLWWIRIDRTWFLNWANTRLPPNRLTYGSAVLHRTSMCLTYTDHATCGICSNRPHLALTVLAIQPKISNIKIGSFLITFNTPRAIIHFIIFTFTLQFIYYCNRTMISGNE